jgi:hypothetical protein
MVRYFSWDYGWRETRPHIITLTHTPEGMERMECDCGAKTAKLKKVGNWIKDHRRLVFGGLLYE